MNQSEQLNELCAALAKAQTQLKRAVKDSVNPHFRSSYADLQSIWDAARPVLQPNGLSISQGFDAGTGEAVTVWTLLMHTSGQWVRSALTLKPVKPDPQGIGSACTYGKRYGLAAILGIVADEDDDGNAASGQHSAPPQPRSAPPPPPQASPSPARAAPAPNGTGWRSVPVPKFCAKKSSDGTVGGMSDNDLRWWAANFTPKEFQGKIQDADVAFKNALKAAVAELDAKAGAAPQDDDDVPF